MRFLLILPLVLFCWNFYFLKKYLEVVIILVKKLQIKKIKNKNKIEKNNYSIVNRK